VRGDVFWGTGEAAATVAGLMKSPGIMVALLPKAVAARLGLSGDDLRSETTGCAPQVLGARLQPVARARAPHHATATEAEEEADEGFTSLSHQGPANPTNRTPRPSRPCKSARANRPGQAREEIRQVRPLPASTGACSGG
jgi:hypothetical protein